MAIELLCGQCQGRFLAEVPGSLVLCPHCGAHLQTPSAETWPSGTLAETSFSEPPPPIDPPAVPTTSEPAAGNPPPGMLPAQGRRSESVGPPGLPAFEPAATTELPSPDASPGVAAATNGIGDSLEGWSPMATVESPATESDLPSEGGAAASLAAWESAPSTEAASFPDFSIAVRDASLAPGAETVLVPPDAAAVADATQVQELPSDAATAFSAAGVSPTVFKFVLSYASAVTLACVYLVWQLRSVPDFNERLESLPDLRPEKPKKGQVVKLIHVPAAAAMNPGHTLRLGESQRYGSVRVTPLRVVRQPLEFAPREGMPPSPDDVSPPVLMLHVRFENVSLDQEFAPLDDELVLARQQSKERLDLYAANQFITALSDKGDRQRQVLAHFENGRNIKGHRFEEELSPGEAYETFIPSDSEGLDRLKGDLLWRVHFRKGYNPKSRRGVTTLIEVAFHEREIVDLTAAATPPVGDDQKRG